MIIEKSRLLRFDGPARESDLRQRMVLDDQRKRTIRVEEARSVFLDAQAKMAGQYGLTSVGASQYFKVLSPGLYQLVRTIVADEETKGFKSSAALISQIVNRVAAHRESQIVGSVALCCDQRNQLDGFFSSKYAQVSNERVYDLFKDACDLLKTRTSLYLAELAGRDLTAVVMPSSPLPGNDGVKLYVGAVCQNGETVGRAIRMSIVVYDRATGSWSVEPFRSDARLPHIRPRKLRDKMMMIGEVLNSRQREAARLPSKFALSRSTRVAKTWDAATIKSFRRKFLVRSHEFSVPAEHIDSVIKLLPAAGKRPPVLLDVYAACLQVASEQTVGRSFGLRQLAFELVFS